MKKTLIPALLIVSTLFTPCLRNAVELPDRAFDLMEEVARPLFWHLWDQLLTSELARGMEGNARSGESRWQPASQRNTLACIFFRIVLKHAFNSALPVARENNPFFVSIPSTFIRRIVETEFSLGHRQWA